MELLIFAYWIIDSNKLVFVPSYLNNDFANTCFKDNICILSHRKLFNTIITVNDSGNFDEIDKVITNYTLVIINTNNFSEIMLFTNERNNVKSNKEVIGTPTKSYNECIPNNAHSFTTETPFNYPPGY